MKNSRLRRMLSTEAEVDNISPRPTSLILHIIGKPNSKIVLIFIQNISKFLTCLLPRRLDFLQNFGQFLGTGYKQMFFLADSPQNVDKIHRAICFACYCIS